MKPYGTLVFIGRFQPFHNGHLHVIQEAAKLAETVLILIGSANVSRSPKDPFTASEREDMIRKSCGGINIAVDYINDYPYSDDAWIAEVQEILEGEQWTNGPIGLVGYSKDSSSYYLKMFPGMHSVAIQSQWGTLNATGLRNLYLDADRPAFPTEVFVPRPVSQFLEHFWLTEEYKWLVKEAAFYRTYDPVKFPVQILCADAVVVQSGHVLLVKRKVSPGQGLFALPGGHVNPDETFQQAAVRELREETGISDQQDLPPYSPPRPMPPAVLASYIRKNRLFDDPKRSLRGRVVTMAYKFEIPPKKNLYYVKGMDDASSATWHPIGTLDPTKMFEDHYHIINIMVNS